jgi:creatinine amidohydrolase
MRLEDLTWMDVEGYLKGDDRLMLVTGSTEQHAYLSLLTDIKIPLALADAASQQTGVLVAPPLNFGISPYFLAYPGTFSLRVSTFTAVLDDLVRSAAGHGFRKILVINGHGGNLPGRQQLGQVLNELPGLKLDWYDWWLSHSIEDVAQKHGIKPAHANWLEAFPFTMTGEMPGTPKVPPSVPSPVMDAKTTREVYGDGSFGGPYFADQEVMHEMFAAALNDILLRLKFGE